MSDAYDQLLEATIQHLEELKAQGVQFVSVSAEDSSILTRSRPAALPALPLQRTSSEAPAREAARPNAAVEPHARVVTQERPLPAKETGSGPISATSSSAAKSAAFAELRQRVLACTKCTHLVAARQNVVFGVGNLEARLMFVGEAPGSDEDQQGEPFVGKAGQLLTKMIQAMGLKRGDIYIANILKCRPDTPGQAAGNRKPTPGEMQTCLPYLHEQIDLIKPEVLVALGATAVEGLLGKTMGITRLRGNWRSYRGIPLMPTYHPAYLLRNQALSERRRVWEDLLQVMEKLSMPISQKQRNYFLGAA
jgi:uracil-DNA glycosylase